MAIKDLDEKIAARKALIEPEGGVTKKMKVVDNLVGACTTPFYCGDQMTLADCHLYVFVSMMRSGYGLLGHMWCLLVGFSMRLLQCQ